MKKSQKTLATVGAIVTAGLAGMHYANILLAKKACKDELLYSQEGSYYSFRFGNIFYTKQGSGQPLLLIHTLNPICSHIEYKALIDELSANYTVYTIDLLGCGRSDKPSITYTAYLYVQMINDFIKNVIGEPTHIIASGISCSPALLACSSEPDLYDKMILINPPSLKQSNRIPTAFLKIFKTLIEVPILGTFLYNCSVSRKKIDRLLETEAFYMPADGEASSYLLRHKKKCVDYLYEGAHLNGYGSKYLYSSLKARYLNANASNALKNIDHSIYIIMGKETTGYDEIIEEYKDINCSIESAVLPKTKHFPHLENSSKFMAVCEIFLS